MLSRFQEQSVKTRYMIEEPLRFGAKEQPTLDDGFTMVQKRDRKKVDPSNAPMIFRAQSAPKKPLDITVGDLIRSDKVQSKGVVDFQDRGKLDTNMEFITLEVSPSGSVAQRKEEEVI